MTQTKQPKTASRSSSHTPGPLRAYERNTDPMNWAIRDADNHMVAEHIPKQLALLFVKAPEMYELAKLVLAWWDTRFGEELNYWADKHEPVFIDAARRIKAEIDGEGS